MNVISPDQTLIPYVPHRISHKDLTCNLRFVTHAATHRKSNERVKRGAARTLHREPCFLCVEYCAQLLLEAVSPIWGKRCLFSRRQLGQRTGRCHARDDHGDHWLHLVGKGEKLGKVALPSMARAALDRYLVQRGLPSTRLLWEPTTPLIGRHKEDGPHSITSSRLWSITKRFFMQVADIIQEQSPSTAEKLRRASPHWMRHTHATHALARGAELTTVRDNLRHASISTTSMYLHGEDAKRARQMDQAFQS